MPQMVIGKRLTVRLHLQTGQFIHLVKDCLRRAGGLEYKGRANNQTRLSTHRLESAVEEIALITEDT